MVGGVRADFYPAPLHVLELFEREIIFFAQLVGYHVDDRRHIVRLQNRQHRRIIIRVAVVEGKHNRLFGEFSFAVHHAHKILQSYRRVALRRKIIQLRGEFGGRHVVNFKVWVKRLVRHLMIF